VLKVSKKEKVNVTEELVDEVVEKILEYKKDKCY